ncbi:MAG: efflux RND transporter permease subunit [Bacteroidales bacterium]|nr:efflux RND transporter permease subunit [Bacteroidales bacterium]
MSLYERSVKKPITTALVYLAVIVLGVFSFFKLSVDLLPDMGENILMVITYYNGASAADIENNVSRPLENTLNGVSDLKHITSYSRENLSFIMMEYEYGVDIDEATNDVRDKLNMVTSSLPDDAGTPFIFKFSAEDLPIMVLTVKAQESMNALYKILDDRVASPLSRINGVGTVSIAGAPQREIQVYCDPYKLESYGMSIESISAVIASENRNTPTGNIDIGSRTYSMRVEGEFSDATQLRDMIIGHYNGQDVYLRDVAVVKDTIQERMLEAYNDGVQGGMIVVQKQSGANSVAISNAVLAKLPELQAELPSDVIITPLVNTSDNIVNTVNSLKETIIITLLLVVAVVLFFLGRWRATIIVAVVIPVSLIASLIYLWISGNTLNIISLSSLSIAIGLVVDDAIVVLENITTHITRGTKPKPAAIFATSEVSVSIVASTLVIFAVFIPLTMTSGMAGILFKQLGWMISIIIFISLMASMSLTPMLSSVLLRLNPEHGRVYRILYSPVEKFLSALDRWYAGVLGWALLHRRWIVLGAAAIVVFALMLIPRIPTEFFPTMDNARLSITVNFPIGTRIEQSRAFAKEFTKHLQENYPEILGTNFSVGQADDSNLFGMLQTNGEYVVSFNIKLKSKVDRTRGVLELADGIRADLAEYPEIRTYAVGLGSGMSSQSSVDLEIYGYDFAETDAIAAEFASRMRKVEGCTEVSISRDEYTPEIEVEFDREKLIQNGLSTTTAATYIRNRFNGAIASYYREDGEEYDIRVRYAPEFRNSVESIENILIYNNAGRGIRVGEVGRVVEKLTPPTIERKDRQRLVTVSCIVGKGAVLSDIVAAAERELSQMDVPADILTNVGGTYEDQQDAFKDLFTMMLLIVILVYIVIAAQFESFTYPFVIMFSVPFGFAGVLFGFFLTKTALGVMALIGLIMLIGIVVKNGIVLIDYTILCRERGMKLYDAVVTAGRSRLRPILMTTCTTVFGMIPLALGRGEGAEMWNSLGMAVAWGLTFSTVVTLLLIPVIYSIFADFGLKRQDRISARKSEA